MAGMADNIIDDATASAIRGALSEPRFARYLHASDGNISAALRLYLWNSKLSESLYIPLQMWEVALRNKLHTFLCWKFSLDWPRDERALRQLTRFDRRRVHEAIERQRQRRNFTSISTDAIVADLSAGFWVALFNQDYEVPAQKSHTHIPF